MKTHGDTSPGYTPFPPSDGRQATTEECAIPGKAHMIYTGIHSHSCSASEQATTKEYSSLEEPHMKTRGDTTSNLLSAGRQATHEEHSIAGGALYET